MDKVQKEQRNYFEWGTEPAKFICDIFPGDVITLRFNEHGKLYIKPVKVICKEKEQQQ